MDEINKRVLAFMDANMLSKNRFAQELSVSLPLITHLVSGRNRPGLDILQKMLTIYPQINPDWLLNGLGTMYREAVKQVDLNAEIAEIQLVAKQLEIEWQKLQQVSEYHQLLKDELIHLSQLDQVMADSKNKTQQIQEVLNQIASRIESKLLD